jgi:subtilase family serine protease
MKLSLKVLLKVKRPGLPAAVVCLILFFSASSSFGAGLKQLHGHVPGILKNLAPIGRLPATNELHLAIGVPLRDPAALDQFLAEVYDPASPNYRHFLTPEEFTARFGATVSDYASVKKFAQANGFEITQEHGNRMLLDVRAKASDVERAFHIRFNRFKHPSEARVFFAPDTEPTVDPDLPVADIQGLSDFSRPQPKFHKIDTKTILQKSGSAPGGSSSYFGDDFRNAYAPGVTLTGAGQSVGLFQVDGFYASDIAKYAQQAGGGRTNIVIQTVLLDGYGGGITSANGNTEVSLDIEMSMAMAPGLSRIILFEGNPTNAFFIPNDILNAMAASNTVKNLSSSWGWGGGPSPTTDNIFKQMASQGQSFFNASGDSDAFTIGANSANGVDNSLNANAPSSCPYITQVGGTTLTMNGTGASYASETVWNWNNSGHPGVGSSGGISSYYSIPDWQTNIIMTANLGSTSQRNIPDVALTGDNVYVISGGSGAGKSGVGGTSCAAPLWAGFMALVNQQAAAIGIPPVGFINPAIYAIGNGQNTNYSYAACFHDTASGNNFWSSSPTNYPAVIGYDLCTGWGTPSGQNLINALAGPPDVLVVAPISGFAAVGAQGGSFSPSSRIFALTNSSSSSINWSLINTSTWLNISSSSGTLAAGAQANLTVSLTAAANSLAVGTYAATLWFSNATTQVAQPRIFTMQVGQSIVQNGGFETGDFAGWTLYGNTTVGGNIYNAVESASSSYGVVHSGSYGAFLGDTQVAILSQTVPTYPGQSYLLSFWLNNPTNGSGQVFKVNWNTNAATNLIFQISSPPAFSWTNYTFILTATGTNTVLQFGAENVPYCFGLDDISVTPIPIPSFTAFSGDANSFALTWNSLAGISYIVQYKTNLLQTNWLNLATNTAAAAAASYTNNDAIDPARFYRIRRLP